MCLHYAHVCAAAKTPSLKKPGLVDCSATLSREELMAKILLGEPTAIMKIGRHLKKVRPLTDMELDESAYYVGVRQHENSKVMKLSKTGGFRGAIFFNGFGMSKEPINEFSSKNNEIAIIVFTQQGLNLAKKLSLKLNKSEIHVGSKRIKTQYIVFTNTGKHVDLFTKGKLLLEFAQWGFCAEFKFQN